ncbi:MAG: molybdopterin oxidoreductase [Calditrichaeota bacterium]|nr:MAG: molybdopterin oxidoreductase [Calditrichota bacterium]
MKKLFWGIVSLLALIGVISIGWRLTAGMKITALSSTVTWGMWVAFYIYFIGLSAGSFLFSTLIYVFGMHKLEKAGKMALLSALFALFGGLLFVWMDLGHPMRFWRVFFNWNHTSVLAWESLFYIFYIVAISLEIWYLMRCDIAALALHATGWKRKFYSFLAFGFRCPTTQEAYDTCHRQSMKVVKVLGIIGIPVAIGVHGGTGALFAVVAARPYWFGPLFPIIFIVSALVSGAALTTFLYAYFGKKEDSDYLDIVKSLANFLVLFIAIDVLLMISEFLTNLYAGLPEHSEVLHEILFGPFNYTFWVGQLLLAIVLPIVLIAWKKSQPNWLGLAGLSAVVGIVAVRLNLVIPAYIVPVLKGLDKAYVNPRWTYSYFPSMGEWLTTIGAIALLVLGFGIAWKLLPIFGEVERRFVDTLPSSVSQREGVSYGK